MSIHIRIIRFLCEHFYFHFKNTKFVSLFVDIDVIGFNINAAKVIKRKNFVLSTFI